MLDDRPTPTPPAAPTTSPAEVAATSAPAPMPIERAALDRVLARAAQLQAVESDPGEPVLTESQLLEVGREVGLADRHIRQALAEERTRVAVPEESGVAARLFGPATVYATRTVPGTAQTVLATLDEWMRREECLSVKRRFADRILWEPRPGLFSEMRRRLKVGGRGYHLSRAQEVAATTIVVDRERVLVRLEADLSNVRQQHVLGGGVTAATGVFTTGVGITIGVAAAVAVLPAAAAIVAGYLISRRHGPTVTRAQLALEQVLDRLERGEIPRSPLLSALDATARLIT